MRTHSSHRSPALLTFQLCLAPTVSTIFVTSAYYWLTIKALCDGQKSCQYENYASIIDECQDGYTSDYAQVFYDCLPVDDAGAVGFTASASTGSPTVYNYFEVVVFDNVLSNFGGHYNPDTSSFVCPFDGVYMVNVNIVSTESDQAQVDVIRNDLPLALALADDLSGLRSHASNTVMTECQRGDVLWIRASIQLTTLHSDYQLCTFSAFMMHWL